MNEAKPPIDGGSGGTARTRRLVDRLSAALKNDFPHDTKLPPPSGAITAHPTAGRDPQKFMYFYYEFQTK